MDQHIVKQNDQMSKLSKCNNQKMLDLLSSQNSLQTSSSQRSNTRTTKYVQCFHFQWFDCW